jgi:hypothetical protein
MLQAIAGRRGARPRVRTPPAAYSLSIHRAARDFKGAGVGGLIIAIIIAKSMDLAAGCGAAPATRAAAVRI